MLPVVFEIIEISFNLLNFKAISFYTALDTNRV